MIEVIYRYRVHHSQVRAFEHAFGAKGPWAAFFGQHPGYRHTRLFRHKSEPCVYVSVDVWGSKRDFDHFRTQHADRYAKLDRELRMLFMEELFLGYYEGEDEYRAPLDTTA